MKDQVRGTSSYDFCYDNARSDHAYYLVAVEGIGIRAVADHLGVTGATAKKLLERKRSRILMSRFVGLLTPEIAMRL